ncbi:MipA/OmpV family protein [Piscinibacter gummiphilus]|uniref:MipA/OmpV family protein n=1 Tax=Piscinibacter gummiphilus TaxID=946333 RepID=A0ABZ0CVH3_9BURK|nr:MipA/OmpV family protein [Piscinibacter gummiphilus]WOB08992.1 MipA/OmpV family protein [Piscinibacter gummiphilus]
MSRRAWRAWFVATALAVAGVGSQAADAAADAAEPEAAPPAATAQAPVKNLKPLWELGLGASGLRLPDYRGSRVSHNYLLPLPYVIYRGTWLRSDRDGTRAMLFDSPRIKLDVSFGAAAPSRGDNPDREGMPDLPGNVEVGPSLNITLDQEVRKRWTLDLRLPLRGVVTLEGSPRYGGATFSPNLNFDLKDPTHGWNVGFLTGPLFANRRYHEQYYQVDAAYARPGRPAYQAEGGYAGWQTIASTSKRFGHTWFGAFARLENLNGAVYADSPLVKRNSSLTVGFGVSWILATSGTMVESRY